MIETVKLGEIFSTGWRLMKSHFVETLGLLVFFTVLSIGIEFLSGIEYIGFVFSFISLAFALVFEMGLVATTVNAVDGKEPYWGVFKAVLPRIWQYLVADVLIATFVLISFFVVFVLAVSVSGVSFEFIGASFDEIVYLQEFHPDDADAISLVWSDLFSSLVLPLILAYIPALYLALRLFFTPYLIIDRNMSAMDAVKLSWKASAGIQGKMLIFFILLYAINIVGILCLLFGVFLTMIITFYAQAALYRQVFPAGIQDPLIVENSADVVVD